MDYTELPDVALSMIIDAGIISPNTKLYNSAKDEIIGILNIDGSITLHLDGIRKTFPYPSGAARAIVNLSVNGWIFWKIRENEKLNDLSFYKRKYLEMQSAKP